MTSLSYSLGTPPNPDVPPEKPSTGGGTPPPTDPVKPPSETEHKPLQE